MPTRKFAWCLLLLPLVAMADDSPLLDSGTDTFGRLLTKQAQLLDSEMDLRIRQNQNNGTAATSVSANPLPGSKQEVKEGEPTVEAIWGLAGKEVAEISYKGRRVPVSMQEPYISKVDGWKLDSIQQYQIQLVRTGGSKVLQRKTILLNWMGGQGGQPITSAADTAPPTNAPIAPITPAITSALIR
ncbi:hypothetical protein [Pseudomonas coronafaciens]|uniref:hypothetical protein n=1 Tax=Pseudomonas coronafaciens TaxID=53409 RepID=UPI000E3D2895|nr:hypothetical protein [Pseudomonas coronafaciens]